MGNAGVAAVVGLGINNQPLVPYLLNQGMSVVVADRKSPDDLSQVLESMGLAKRVEVLGGDQYLDKLAQRTDLATVYLTPGMAKNGVSIQRLAATGVHITCETDLFLRECPAPVIGITGSAGKTTTTSLVSEALKHDGRRPVFVGGNIGHPLLPDLPTISPDSWVVMELSSFQLELVERSPHGAAILNLTPNHLDVHPSMEAYAAAKQRIVAFQHAQDWAVLPYDDPVVAPLWQHHRGRRVFFSLNGPIAHGAYLSNGRLWWRGGKGAREVIGVDALRLPGVHNLANSLAAIAMVASAGGDLEAVADVLATFKGVPHRLERIREVEGVTFVNDSIATSPARTIAALQAIAGPIVLIAGGYDKQLEYDSLGKAIANSGVRAIITLGQTADKISRAVRAYGQTALFAADNLEQAVVTAAQVAQQGDTVLLSPASASYDMFNNFEERGDLFRNLVSRL